MDIVSIVSAVVLVASPFVVKYVTEGLKKLRSIELSSNRTNVIKASVAGLSLVIAVLNAWLTGGDVDSNLVNNTLESIVYAVVTYFAAIGSYHDTKK